MMKQFDSEMEYSLDRLAEDESEITVTANSLDWVKYPFCDIQFKITSSESWDGKKHLSCGQKIKLAKRNDEQ